MTVGGLPRPDWPPPPMTERAFHFVTDAAALERVAGDVVAGAKEIGVDAEMNGLHAFRARVCVLQIATDDADVVVDTVAVKDLRPLAAALASKDVIHYLHGAAHDVKCMKSDFGITFGGLFDTYIAAQLLGVEKLGYGDIVQQRFGVQLDKGLQTYDWGRRPLAEKQIEYLRGDVRYLIELGRQLRRALVENDLAEEAQHEFLRVAALPAETDDLAEDAYLKPKESRELPPAGLAVLRELFLVRHAMARGLDRPPFKVVRDEVLVDIAKRRPATPEAMSRVSGLPRHASPRMLAELVGAVTRGLAAGSPPAIVRAPAPRLDGDEIRARRGREDALRQWRKKVATERKVPPMAVLPTYALDDLVRDPPSSLGALGERPGMIRKRVERYGEGILQALAAATPAPRGPRPGSGVSATPAPGGTK